MPTLKKLELFSYDANPNGTVKIPSLMKHFQQIAREDLYQYGITYSSMREVNQVFVIIKEKIEFKKKIFIYDELYLKTVPTKTVGVMFFRDFFISDSNGNIVAEASTAWVLMDYVSRRIIRPKDIFKPISEFPEQASNVVLSRRFSFTDSPAKKTTNVRKVYYSNLDENNHLNNTETAAFAIDEVSEKINNGLQITEFEIHFSHESVLHDDLHINCEYWQDFVYISATNESVDSIAFECVIKFG